MDSRDDKKDYKKFLISQWTGKEIESFKKPSLMDLEVQGEYFRPLIREYIPIRKDVEVLEIGCGWGGFVYNLKREGYGNIDAIDIIPECCEFVEKEIGINVQRIDIFSFFKNNIKKYDVIVALDVIEHFNKGEIVSLMQAIYQTLNNKGVFIMKSPYGGSLKGLYIRYSGFTHETAFTALSINEIFKAVGFEKVYCIPEPDASSNIIIKLAKKVTRQIIGRLLTIDPDYLYSSNIIGIGMKIYEE